MPIQPIDPSKKTSGDGSEKYTPNEKRGPSEFDKTMEKVEAENARAKAHQMAEEHRAKVEAERPRTYTERLQDMGRLPKPGGGAGAESGFGIQKMNKNLNRNYKFGGKVKSASARADGCCIRGKTRA